MRYSWEISTRTRKLFNILQGSGKEKQSFSWRRKHSDRLGKPKPGRASYSISYKDVRQRSRLSFSRRRKHSDTLGKPQPGRTSYLKTYCRDHISYLCKHKSPNQLGYYSGPTSIYLQKLNSPCTTR